jgi:hypothetical protein
MKERFKNLLQVLALLALVILIFGLALCASGCASTQQPPPVKVPAPCIVAIEPLPAPVLPAKPQYPHDADEEELKAWALSLGEALEQVEAVLRKRDAAWLEKVTAHNALVPACGEPVP